MTELSRRTASLATLETDNALRAETFRALPEDIDLWRFREVLTKLGAALGLSGGAVVYALDLMGLLTEADWRGDGRAVTFHSVRTYARKVGRSERTICEYERQLIAAGLMHRTLKHARRHGGHGDDRRRTGLDWRAFGAMMPELLARLDARRAEEQRRLDVEARIREERRLVLGLADGLEEGRARAVAAQLQAMRVMRLAGTAELADLDARLGELVCLRAALVEETGDILAPCPESADRSEDSGGRIDDTDNLSCPTDIRGAGESAADAPECKRPDGRIGMESANAPRITTQDDGPGIDAIPLNEIWDAAPESWKHALGEGTAITWPALIEVAGHIAPQLHVSGYAWSRALRMLGPSEAALALMVLDRNRRHPTRPVHSVGGALVGMTRRAGQGDFRLAPSVYGIMGRADAVDRHARAFA